MHYRTFTVLTLAALTTACGGDGNNGETTFGTATATDGTSGATLTATASASDGTDSAGTDSTTGVPTTGGSEDPTDAMRALVGAQCQWYFDCCSRGELDVLLGAFTGDADACTTRVMDSLAAGNMEPPVEGGPSDLLLYAIFSVNSGRAELNAGAVMQCVDQLSTQACNMLVEPAEFCTPPDADPMVDKCAPERLFLGIQQVGDDCTPTVPYECAPGLRCVGFGEVGVCAQPSVEGENCFDDDDCAPELLCDFQTGTCAVPSALGEACSYTNPDAPLPGTEAQRCEPGLSCNPVDLVCVGPCSTGSPCVGDAECPESHVCALGLCQMPLPDNAPCEENPDCASNICDPVALACTPLIALNQACTTSPECASGWCDTATLLCANPKGTGVACPSGQNAECMAGNRCTANVCTAIPGVGQACDAATNPCDTDLVCSGGTCQEPPLLNGNSCVTDDQCQSGLCYFDFCAAKGNNGEVCGDMVSKPCGDKSYCNIEAGAMSGVCEMSPIPGDPCETSTECAGQCIVAWGQQMCDATPFPGEVWCDGM